jgi:hypothetical protein
LSKIDLPEGYQLGVTSIRSELFLAEFGLLFVKNGHHVGYLMIGFFGRFYPFLGAISVMKWSFLRNVAKSRYSDNSESKLNLVNLDEL